MLRTRRGCLIPRGEFGKLTFQCPFMPQLVHGTGGGLRVRQESAQWPSLPHLKQGRWLLVFVS